MKPFAVIALAAALALGTAPRAEAQSYGTFGGAEPLPVNTHLFGAYLNAGERVVGLLAQLRLSFYPGIDFGFQGGLARIDLGADDQTTLRLGIDVKGLVASHETGAPADFAIGGHLGLESGDGYDILRIGPTVVASRRLAMGQNGAFVPYASAGLLFSRLDLDTGDETDFALPFRVGAELQVVPGMRFVGEMQFNLSDDINDNFEIAAGVNMPF